MQRSIYLSLAILAVLTFQPIQAQQIYLPVSSESETAVKHYTKGMDAAFNADFAQMQEHMGKATAEDPGFFMAYFQPAMVSWWFQNPEGFEKQYAKAMGCKGELNSTEQICKQILMAIKADPAADVSNLGKKLADAAPEIVEAHVWHGHLSGFTQNPKGSLPAYQKAEGLAPDNASIQNVLGYTYMTDGQMTKAEKAFDKYLELQPNHANPYDSKGDFLMAAGKYAEAEEMFRKAFRMNEGFTGSQNKAEVAAAMQVAARETASFMKRDYDAWADCYKKGPAIVFAYTGKGGTWQYQGWQEVSKGIREFFAENPEPSEGAFTRSNFHWRVRQDNVWVTYDQKRGDNTTKEMRVLDKVDGEYKMLMMNAIGTSSYEAPAKIENTLKSVSVFKASPSVELTELSASMGRMNAAIEAIGYPDAGYKVWMANGKEGADAQMMVEGYWPDQATYDTIHGHELYKAARQKEEPFWKELERVSYNRFSKIQ